ncbi:MAG: Crp/Fnr family transcriptional regulator [Spirochaetia bacterium]|nr:Crp/Fnr family transcriptional regulator [Spirochaetia bacterium]
MAETNSNSSAVVTPGFFSRLTKSGSAVLERIRRKRILRKNHHLLHEGDDAGQFFEIVQGMVRIYRTTREAKEQTLEIHRAGDLAGLRDCLGQTTFHHSAVCMEDCEVYVYTLANLQEILAADPAFHRVIASWLASGWVASENRVHSLCTKPVHGRLAELILSLGSQNDSICFDFTRETLASLLGTSTETIIRALSDFKSRHWIEVEKRSVRICNPAELMRLAEMHDRGLAVAS